MLFINTIETFIKITHSEMYMSDEQRLTSKEINKMNKKPFLQWINERREGITSLSYYDWCIFNNVTIHHGRFESMRELDKLANTSNSYRGEF